MSRLIGLLGVKGSGKDTLAKYLIDHRGYVRTAFADALYQEAADAYLVSVDFLNRRDTKETEMSALRLALCAERQFVETALNGLTRSRRLRDQALAYYDTGRVPPHAGARAVKRLMNAPRSPRWTLQLWGTEFRRKGRYGVDTFWLDKVRSQVEASPSTLFVVTDVRFHNEANFIEQMGGMLVRVRRPVLEAREAAERSRRGRAAHASETELLNRLVDFEAVNVEGQPDSLLRCVEQMLPVAVRHAA